MTKDPLFKASVSCADARKVKNFKDLCFGFSLELVVSADWHRFLQTTILSWQTNQLQLEAYAYSFSPINAIYLSMQRASNLGA